MHYRIAVVLAMLIALTGLAAPAAFADPQLPINSCTVGHNYGPYILLANDNQGLGITFPGPGNQATVTSILPPGSPSNISFQCVSGTGIIEYVIHNSNGNCLRMRDANNGYAVMEESGCNTNDLSERFVVHGPGTNGSKDTFQNDGEGRWLGVSCGVQDGWKVWGVRNVSGNCLKWLLELQ
jgi:hypothetical protein